MNNTNDTTKKRKFKHLADEDRIRIEVLKQEGYKQGEIAKRIGFSESTISRELQRNSIEQMDTNLRTIRCYFSDAADRQARERWARTGAKIKVWKVKKTLDEIDNRMLTEKRSPDAIIGEMKRKAGGSVGISTKSIYNYIEAGYMKTKNLDLPQKVQRRIKRRPPQAKRLQKGRSIEDRPEAANNRTEFGHWEMDGVLGKANGAEELITIVERKTLMTRIVKCERTQRAVADALRKIEREFGKIFPKVFKSITTDNGVEFLDSVGIEKSHYKNRKVRTTHYFAHPYSAFERGSNENVNGLIRRFIPKGTDLNTISNEFILWIERWINTLPRKIFGYYAAQDLFNEFVVRYQ